MQFFIAVREESQRKTMAGRGRGCLLWWRGGGWWRRGVAHGVRVDRDSPSMGAQLARLFAPETTIDKQEKHQAPLGLIPNWPLT